jgi:hypothetical protein
MLRPAAACALVVLASVALSADAQVQEAQFYFLASVATHRLSLRSAACSAHSVVRMHEAQKVGAHACTALCGAGGSGRYEGGCAPSCPAEEPTRIRGDRSLRLGPGPGQGALLHGTEIDAGHAVAAQQPLFLAASWLPLLVPASARASHVRCAPCYDAGSHCMLPCSWRRCTNLSPKP